MSVSSADLGTMPLRPLLARLVHDVGKYIARTARNVGPGQWTPALAAMLAHDLFELPGGRASAVFARFADPVETIVRYPELTQVRGWLIEIEGLENAIRAAEVDACARAAAIALAVEESLRALLRNLEKETP